MTPFNIAVLFCRLLALWCVARFVETFGRVVAPLLSTFIFSSSSNNFSSRNDGAASLGAALGMIFLACALWLGAPMIARSVAQNIEYSNVIEQPKTTRNWWNIGRGLLGLYFLVIGLSGICNSVLYLLITLKYSANALVTAFGTSQPMKLLYFVPAVSSLFTAMLGAWLMLMARRALNKDALSSPSQDAK